MTRVRGGEGGIWWQTQYISMRSYTFHMPKLEKRVEIDISSALILFSYVSFFRMITFSSHTKKARANRARGGLGGKYQPPTPPQNRSVTCLIHQYDDRLPHNNTKLHNRLEQNGPPGRTESRWTPAWMGVKNRLNYQVGEIFLALVVNIYI